MYYIGVDIGGMSIKGGVVDQNGNIIYKDTVRTAPQKDYKEIIADIATLCFKIIEGAGLKKEDISGIGMGIPGTINSKKGVITYANNINFENVPIVAEFKKYLDIPVKIGNDANCAALGEVVFGGAKGIKNAVFVTLGTGVGSGIIIDGEIFEGEAGAGAEAGHMVIRTGGELCTCGRKGCWEAYASASALIKQTQKGIEKNPESLMAKIAKEEGKISGRTAFRAARDGDKAGKNVSNRYIKYVAEGLINIVNVFRPEVILIGGGVSNEGSYLISRLQRLVTTYSYGGKRNPYVKVAKASLLNDAGILGAASLVIK